MGRSSDETAAGVDPDESPADGAPPLPDGPQDGHEPATLLFPVVDGEVLLIHKKRGVGAGLYNGPGGTVEAGETVRKAAVRETVEEVRAEPRGVAYAGELDFRFGDEPFTYVYVYRATGLAGTPEETAEADPEWFEVESVPYDEMWEDDRHWLPQVLAGRSVAGTFRFDADGDELRDWTLAVEESGGRG
jgi:ADP-ribose pyrophosphatase YjhB (NUDIX family)